MNMRNTITCTCIYTGCMFAIAPIGFETPHMIAVYMESHQNNTVTLTTADANLSKSIAVITYREWYEQVNSSLDCHIDSLEVYRGRQQITEISRSGFSISENGTIQVMLVRFTKI